MALEVALRLLNALFPSFSNSFNSPLSQSSACKVIRLHSFNSVIPVPPPAEGNLIPCYSAFRGCNLSQSYVSVKEFFRYRYRLRMKFFRVLPCLPWLLLPSLRGGREGVGAST